MYFHLAQNSQTLYLNSPVLLQHSASSSPQISMGVLSLRSTSSISASLK